MKKITLMLLLASFTTVMNAQNQVEQPEAVNTECVEEETKQEESIKKRKKYRSKAAYRISCQDGKQSSPYAFSNRTILRKKQKH